MSQQTMIGFIWYKRENYDRLLAMFDDRDNLPATYDEWLVRAECGRKDQESKGVRVLCVDIDPDEFAAWCKAKGMKPDSKARLGYLNEYQYKYIKG